MSRPDRYPARAIGDHIDEAIAFSGAERAREADNIAGETQALAKRARAAGFSAIGHLLEAAAMEARAEAATQRRSGDI